MKRAIIFALVAFLVALGGTTGFLVKSYKPPVVPVDSMAAKGDSTRPDSARTGSIHADSAKTGPVTAVQHGSVVPAGDTPGHAAPTALAVPAERPSTPTADPVAKAGAYKQVARVLSAMKPPEAAKVIAFLSDDEVEGLLRSVGPRQAADFLTNIPKERAAVLSRRLLTPKPAGATR